MSACGSNADVSESRPFATCVINTEKLIVRKFCDYLAKNELSHCKRCYNINIVNERGAAMEEWVKRGYLNEDFRLFHIRDKIELELNYHYHEFDKIVVFLSGQVTYVVESKAYFLNPWDIVLVPHGQIHRPIIDTSEHYERITLWIKPDYLKNSSLGGDDLRQCFERA